MSEYAKGFWMGVGLTLSAVLVFSTCGCSGFHAVVHKDPDVALLSVTPEDVTEYYAEMTSQEPVDPQAVLYVPDKKAYLVKEEFMDEAMSKVTMYEILTNAKHIPAFIEDYNPDTVGAAFKRSAFDVGLGSAATLGVIFGLLGM